MRTWRFVASACTLLIGTSALCQQTDQASPGDLLSVIARNAEQEKNQAAARRAMNLKWALGVLRPSDVEGVQCGRNSVPIKINVSQATDIAGKMLDPALKKYLPALAAAIASAPTAAAILFLTPTETGTDAVEILNHTETRTRAEVQGAAREMLQDPPNLFKKSEGTALLKKVVACAI